MDTYLLLSALLLLIPLIVVLYVKRRHNYWRSKGVPQLEPHFFFGNTKALFTKETSMSEVFLDLYKQFKFKANDLKYGGYYSLFCRPVLMAFDPDLIKSIVIKDFDHFMDRGRFINEKTDPLSAHLAFLSGERWRTMRNKLSPTFTSGKMKMMFETFLECTNDLKTIMDDIIVTKDPIDVKDVLQRFTTDIIASVAFGLDFNTMKDPENEFRQLGKKMLKPSQLRIIKEMLAQILPESILLAIGFRMTDKNVEDFFMKLVKDTVEYREKNNIYRKDLMHLLLQLKNRGKVSDDETITNPNDNTEFGLTIEEIAAQCFVFFGAGFETSSTTMTFALYELAENQDIQDKLRKEINMVLKQHDNKVTYDAIMDMDYLDKVIKETLRLHSPVAAIGRLCIKDYKIPGTDVVIEKGTPVYLPILGMQMDPEYFPDPERFDPEKFSNENVAKRSPYVYMPFGEGPRQCIGLRFALLQSKVGLMTLIKNYKITLNSKTKTPIKLDKYHFLAGVEGGVWLNAETIK